MRRFLILALSASLLVGLSAFTRLSAQDEKKEGQDPAPAPAQDEKKAEPAKPAEPGTPEVAPAPEPKPIPPEVQAKLDAARRAVAEAIVAAQDAGLVDTTISPPPILDILITGRADDRAKLKAVTKENPEAALSPEVFGAWYTGYGQAEGVVADKNVRIVRPSKGLKAWYDERNRIFSSLIEEVRKAKPAAAPAPTTAPAEAPKATETAPAPAETAPAPPAEPAKTPEAKPEEAKAADAPGA